MLWQNSNKLSGQPNMLSNIFFCLFPLRVVSLGPLSAFTSTLSWVLYPFECLSLPASFLPPVCCFWHTGCILRSTRWINISTEDFSGSIFSQPFHPAICLWCPLFPPSSFLLEFRDALISAKLWSRPQGWQSFGLFPIPCYEYPCLTWVFHSSLGFSFHPDLDCLMLPSYLPCLALAVLLLPNLIMKHISHCLFVPWFNALCVCLHIRMPV